MIRHFFILFISLMALTAHAQKMPTDAFQGIMPVTDEKYSISLNGTWNLKVIEGNVDVKDVPQRDDTWGTIPVPGCWEIYGFCKASYDKATPHTGYYRTDFTVPNEWKGQRIVLRFDGVLYGYDLWINNQFVGSWRSGYNTALFDITDFIDLKNDKQHLSMRVLSTFPGSDFDYNDDWAPTGIFRDVTLFTVPKIHMSDISIRTKMSGDVIVDYLVANADKHTSVSYAIYDTEGNNVGTTKVNNPILWSAETPYLYTLKLNLSHKGKSLQEFEYKFGIRELTIDGKILKLNGQPIKLRGVNCHATDPNTGKVISEEVTLEDMRLMKKASVNFIRTSHYPREPRFYELADSLGFYVINEVPFGFGDKHLYDSTYYPVLQQRAQATIRRDKNHTSVLIWSLGNENPLTDICVKLGKYVKTELDQHRPICYPQVGSYFRKFNYDFTDVADIYAPHYPTTSQIADFYQRGERPIIFTEYCHTLGISLEDHDRQWEIIERTPCIAGGSIWEWNDQGMPFSETLTSRYGYEERVFTSDKGGFEMFGNKGTDGLLYADRTPLPNYYELRHNYAQAAITDTTLTLKGNTVTLNVRNRFDFINLKDNVSFFWHVTADRDTIAQGVFSPECKPHCTTTYDLALPYNIDTRKVCLLHIDIRNSQGLSFNNQTLPLLKKDKPTQLYQRLLSALRQAPTTSLSDMIQEETLIRAGRKATLSELIRVKDTRLEKYLIRRTDDGRRAGPIATDITAEQLGAVTHYNVTLTPDSLNIFLSELGVAMLLNEEITNVQWIGNGIMPTYPGRYKAGRYGFWSLHKDDLYFEGNRQGVDAALLTTTEGDGILLFCNNGNVNFEQTDKGIVVTYNLAVSGQGPKFARTAFPVMADKTSSLKGDFYLYRVDKDNCPAVISELFNSGEYNIVPFAPFKKQYDTYLMRFNDIVQ